jgi:mannitol/fructose-specific phosphotransferase system IIA component (Ntr-type)
MVSTEMTKISFTAEFPVALRAGVIIPHPRAVAANSMAVIFVAQSTLMLLYSG